MSFILFYLLSFNPPLVRCKCSADGGGKVKAGRQVKQSSEPGEGGDAGATACVTKLSSLDRKGNFLDKLRAFMSQNWKPNGLSTKLNSWLSRTGFPVWRIYAWGGFLSCLQLWSLRVMWNFTRLPAKLSPRLDCRLQSLLLRSRQIGADPCAVRQHTDASVDSSSLRDMLTGQESVFELMLGFFIFHLYLLRRGLIQRMASKKSEFFKVWRFGRIIRPDCWLSGQNILLLQLFPLITSKYLETPHTVLPNARDQTFNLRDFVQPFAVIVQSFWPWVPLSQSLHLAGMQGWRDATNVSAPSSNQHHRTTYWVSAASLS